MDVYVLYTCVYVCVCDSVQCCVCVRWRCVVCVTRVYSGVCVYVCMAMCMCSGVCVFDRVYSGCVRAWKVVCVCTCVGVSKGEYDVMTRHNTKPCTFLVSSNVANSLQTETSAAATFRPVGSPVLL